MNSNFSIVENNVVILSQSIEDFTNRPNILFNNFGWYILIGDNETYVGQSDGKYIKSRMTELFNEDKFSWAKKIIGIVITDYPFKLSLAHLIEKQIIQRLWVINKNILQNQSLGIDKPASKQDLQAAGRILNVIDANMSKVIPIPQIMLVKPRPKR